MLYTNTIRIPRGNVFLGPSFVRLNQTSAPDHDNMCTAGCPPACFPQIKDLSKKRTTVNQAVWRHHGEVADQQRGPRQGREQENKALHRTVAETSGRLSRLELEQQLQRALGAGAGEGGPGRGAGAGAGAGWRRRRGRLRGGEGAVGERASAYRRWRRAEVAERRATGLALRTGSCASPWTPCRTCRCSWLAWSRTTGSWMRRTWSCAGWWRPCFTGAKVAQMERENQELERGSRS